MGILERVRSKVREMREEYREKREKARRLKELEKEIEEADRKDDVIKEYEKLEKKHKPTLLKKYERKYGGAGSVYLHSDLMELAEKRVEERRSKKNKEKEKKNVSEKLRRANEIADTFAKEFAGDLYRPKKSGKGKGKNKRGKKGKTKQNKKSKPAIQEISEIGMEFSEFLGFGKKGRGRGKDPFDFWDLL